MENSQTHTSTNTHTYSKTNHNQCQKNRQNPYKRRHTSNNLRLICYNATLHYKIIANKQHPNHSQHKKHKQPTQLTYVLQTGQYQSLKFSSSFYFCHPTLSQLEEEASPSVGVDSLAGGSEGGKPRFTNDVNLPPISSSPE